MPELKFADDPKEQCSIPFLMRKYKITWKAAEKMIEDLYKEAGIIFVKKEENFS
jgi:hypothetical protein